MTVLTPDELAAVLASIEDTLDTLDNGDAADWLNAIDPDVLRSAQAKLGTDVPPELAAETINPMSDAELTAGPSWPTLLRRLGLNPGNMAGALVAPGLGEPRETRVVPPGLSQLEEVMFHELADMHAALGMFRGWGDDVLFDLELAGIHYPLMPDALWRMGNRWGYWAEGERWEAAAPLPEPSPNGHLFRETRHVRAECPACAEADASEQAKRPDPATVARMAVQKVGPIEAGSVLIFRGVDWGHEDVAMMEESLLAEHAAGRLAHLPLIVMLPLEAELTLQTDDELRTLLEEARDAARRRREGGE